MTHMMVYYLLSFTIVLTRVLVVHSSHLRYLVHSPTVFFEHDVNVTITAYYVFVVPVGIRSEYAPVWGERLHDHL